MRFINKDISHLPKTEQIGIIIFEIITHPYFSYIVVGHQTWVDKNNERKQLLYYAYKIVKEDDIYHEAVNYINVDKDLCEVVQRAVNGSRTEYNKIEAISMYNKLVERNKKFSMII